MSCKELLAGEEERISLVIKSTFKTSEFIPETDGATCSVKLQDSTGYINMESRSTLNKIEL